ncbi:MAG: hypothetical protein VW646_02180, partial [Hydrogenophilales bacterium]
FFNLRISTESMLSTYGCVLTIDENFPSTSQCIFASGKLFFIRVMDGNVCTISPIELSFMIKMLIFGTHIFNRYEK